MREIKWICMTSIFILVFIVIIVIIGFFQLIDLIIKRIMNVRI